jgi:hypothetical protein
VAKKNNTIWWILGGIGIIVAGLFIFKVFEFRPGEGIGAGDFWQDKPEPVAGGMV